MKKNIIYYDVLETSSYIQSLKYLRISISVNFLT